MQRVLLVTAPLLSALIALVFFSFDEKEPVFRLTDPEQAEAPLKEEVMYGYKIMMNTKELLPKNVGNELSCSNCHFNAGDTKGGKNNGIPLAGVAAVYPVYNERAQKVIDLPMRINSCFERSMNGKKLDPESREMIALLTYLHWISKEYPMCRPVPWRGLTPLKNTLKPDSSKGKELFALCCASCHGANGEGHNKPGLHTPSLWGEGSFNDGAGMNQQEILAAFIHANMPHNLPELSEKEAHDIASYVLENPRPKFKN